MKSIKTIHTDTIGFLDVHFESLDSLKSKILWYYNTGVYNEK